MVRSDLIIAGSNFIFSHINKNYSKYLSLKKKFLVILEVLMLIILIHQPLRVEEDQLLVDWN